MGIAIGRHLVRPYGTWVRVLDDGNVEMDRGHHLLVNGDLDHDDARVFKASASETYGTLRRVYV